MVVWIGRFAGAAGEGSGVFGAGADVGAHRIKAAVVGGPPGRVELVWAADVPTPAGVFGPEGRLDPLAAGQALAGLLAGAPVSPGTAGAVVLPSAALRVRRLPAGAAADPAALARVLAEDAELRVPGVPLEGLHHAVGAPGGTLPAGHGDAGLPVLAAAASRDVVRAYGAAGAEAGLRPARLAAPAAALANLHAVLHPEEAGSAVLLLHVGSARSDLVVVHGGAPLLVLPVAQGLDPLLERVRSAAGPGAPGPERLLQQGLSGEAAPAVDEWARRLRGAHRTAVGAAERHLGAALEALPVRISGGAARLPALVERLSAALPVPVGLLDPAGRFSAPPGGEPPGPSLALALGAAVEAHAAAHPGDEEGRRRPVLLDLSLPDGVAPGAAWRMAASAVARGPGVWAALLGAVLLAAGVPAWQQRRLDQVEAELEERRRDVGLEAGRVASDSARVAALQADSARLAGALGVLAVREAARYRWPRLMHGAAQALPPYAWLEGVELDPEAPGGPQRFRVRAVAPTQADASRYERALRGAAGAAEAVLEGSESLALGPSALVGFRVGGAYGAARAGEGHPRPGGAGYHAGTPTALPSSSAP